MSTQPVSIAEFLTQAGGDGPPIGVLATRERTAQTTAQLITQIPDTFEIRVVGGDALGTKDQLYTEFARAWNFGPHFGRNADAFDECMRELDDTAGEGQSSPAQGYLTIITDAARILPGAEATVDWFAESVDFYRDHYRDIAEPPATFAVILITPAAERQQVVTRWGRTGHTPAEITR